MAEIKVKLSKIEESIDELKSMFSEVAIGKADRQSIREWLEETAKDSKANRDNLVSLQIEKERIISVSRSEHQAMKADIDAAHGLIRAMKTDRDEERKLFQQEREENQKFRTDVKSYAKVGILVVAAIQFFIQIEPMLVRFFQR